MRYNFAGHQYFTALVYGVAGVLVQGLCGSLQLSTGCQVIPRVSFAAGLSS